MAEYIEREALLEKAKALQGGSFSAPLIIEQIEKAPSADVVEVGHETWELEESYLYWDSPDQHLICTCCGYTHQYDEWFDYCPNCGAKMVGKEV